MLEKFNKEKEKNNFPIYLYNTLSREKELFKSISGNEIKIYSCGPTVYHYAHLGNLRAYVFADILNNTLREAGYNIKHQINITDVGHNVGDGDNGEDKMELAIKRENKSLWELADFYTEAFWNDLKELNIKKDKFIWSKATQFINEQIEMIKILEERGFTYKTSDGLYFDTSKFPKYPELGKLNLSGNEKGIRISDEKNEKKNNSDFCLWKNKKENENIGMKWDSPWGTGVPGWHIECSAMSRAILGEHLDIHTGGIDHIPVHHTNEIAQSECSLPDLTPTLSKGEGETQNTNTKFVNYWMHVNFLGLSPALSSGKGEVEKMSKSKGDFLRLESLKQKNISPLAYRYLLLMTHYRKEIKFSWESLEAANTAYEKLLKQVEKIKKQGRESSESAPTSGELSEGLRGTYLEKFIKAMHDDLNTSIALATLWSVINDKTLENSEKYNLIKTFDKYLGLGL